MVVRSKKTKQRPLVSIKQKKPSFYERSKAHLRKHRKIYGAVAAATTTAAAVGAYSLHKSKSREAAEQASKAAKQAAETSAKAAQVKAAAEEQAAKAKQAMDEANKQAENARKLAAKADAAATAEAKENPNISLLSSELLLSGKNKLKHVTPNEKTIYPPTDKLGIHAELLNKHKEREKRVRDSVSSLHDNEEQIMINIINNTSVDELSKKLYSLSNADMDKYLEFMTALHSINQQKHREVLEKINSFIKSNIGKYSSKKSNGTTKVNSIFGTLNIPTDPNADLGPGIQTVEFGRRRKTKMNLKSLKKDLKKLKKV